MTVIELWNAFENWAPFTSVEVNDIRGAFDKVMIILKG